VNRSSAQTECPRNQLIRVRVNQNIQSIAAPNASLLTLPISFDEGCKVTLLGKEETPGFANQQMFHICDWIVAWKHERERTLTHEARFSPDDKYSKQRVTLKKRFGLLLTQQPKREITV
jgi:hypothetical protein